MLQNMGNLNPSDKDKATAFHHAAENGHWEICYLIIKYLKHKNPGDILGFIHSEWPPEDLPINLYLKCCRQEKPWDGHLCILLLKMVKWKSVN
jgi:ankyrin repeat protein